MVYRFIYFRPEYIGGWPSLLLTRDGAASRRETGTHSESDGLCSLLLTGGGGAASQQETGTHC